MSDVSAKAAQFVVVTYRDDLPNRMIQANPHSSYSAWLREVTIPTDQAADLYNQLHAALFGDGQ